MPNLENPTSSRESFDKNEEDIAQKKQALAEAVATGDYDKVAILAQEAKDIEAAKGKTIEDARNEALEDNARIDEAKAAEEKANKEATLAETTRLDAEKSSEEAAKLLEKLKGGHGGSSSATENAEPAQEDVTLSAEAQGIEESLMRLYGAANLMGFGQNPELHSTRAALEGLDARTQEKLGQDFFDRTIIQIGNTRDAYSVYLRCFKGTALGDTFAKLEDARLQAAGFGPFKL